MVTYSILADKLINMADIDWKDREDQRNTCRYGLEMLLVFVTNCILVLFIGIVLGKLKEIFIYSYVWGSLRLSAGGRHANSHLQCIVTYITGMLLVVYGGEYLAVGNNINGWIFLSMFAGFVVNVIYAGRHKEDMTEQRKNKRKALLAWGIHFLFICYFMWRPMGIEMQYDMILISGAVMVESFFLLPIKKKETSFSRNSKRNLR